MSWQNRGCHGNHTRLCPRPVQKIKHYVESAEVLHFPGMATLWSLDERMREAMVLQGTVTCVHTGRVFRDLMTIPRGVSQVRGRLLHRHSDSNAMWRYRFYCIVAVVSSITVTVLRLLHCCRG